MVTDFKSSMPLIAKPATGNDSEPVPPNFLPQKLSVSKIFPPQNKN
jgi:hypothetical protein